MSDLFSHADPVPSSERQQPVRRQAEVVVPVDALRAFDGFTDGIHLWWPVAEYNILGDDSHIGFEDGDLVEESAEGEQALLGAVELWNAGAELVLVGSEVGGSSSSTGVLRVLFLPAGPEETVVRLANDVPTHADVPFLALVQDWQAVLNRYARFMGSGPTEFPVD
jgi:hypothetical protein